jgi:hypothetical protein
MPDNSPAPARKGKIARLPAQIREEVNQRLYNGETGPRIIAWLHTQPEVLAVLDEHFGEEPITAQNLSEWRQGGYQDWLARRERVENLGVLSEYALKLAKAGGSISDGAAAIAGGKILEYLEAVEGEDTLDAAIALAKLRDGDAKMLRARVSELQLDQRERQLALEEAKFQRQTCELFLKWYDDKKAREIASSGTSTEGKVQLLIPLMFGTRPAKGDAS